MLGIARRAQAHITAKEIPISNLKKHKKAHRDKVKIPTCRIILLCPLLDPFPPPLSSPLCTLAVYPFSFSLQL